MGFLCSGEVLGAVGPYKAGMNVSRAPTDFSPPYVDFPLLSSMQREVGLLVICTIWFRPLDGCSCASGTMRPR